MTSGGGEKQLTKPLLVSVFSADAKQGKEGGQVNITEFEVE